jgi:hypothetical protein
MALETFDLPHAPEFEKLLEEANRRLASELTVPKEVRELVLQVADVVSTTEEPEFGDMDPYLLTALHRGAVRSLVALIREQDPREQRRALRVTLEQMRHALRDLNEGLPVREGEDTKEIAMWLARVLEVPQPKLAELLGVSPRQLQRWISPNLASSPKGDDASRLRVVARIVNNLRHAMTAKGVLHWFEHPHPELKGDTPATLLRTGSPENIEHLLRLAASARSHAAT